MPLSHDAGVLSGEEWVAFREGDGGTRVTVAAPDAGLYRLAILAERAGQSGELRLFVSADAGTGHAYASVSSDFAALTAPLVLSDRIGSTVSFDLPHRREVTITGSLEGEKEAYASPSVLIVPSKAGSTVQVKFPRAGPQTLNLWAEAPGQKTPAYSGLHFDVSKAATDGFLVIPPGVVALAGAPNEGLTLSNHLGRSFELHFAVRRDVELEGEIAPLENKTEVHHATLSTHDGVTTVAFEFPKPGSYLLSLWARRKKTPWAGETATLVVSE
jgi:hypothetical protein